MSQVNCEEEMGRKSGFVYWTSQTGDLLRTHTTLYSKLTIVWNGCQFCWYHDTDCIAESVHTMKPTKIKTNSHFKKMIYNTKGTENWLARLKDTVRHCHRKPAPGTKEQSSVMNRWFSDIIGVCVRQVLLYLRPGCVTCIGTLMVDFTFFPSSVSSSMSMLSQCWKTNSPMNRPATKTT